MRGLYLRRLHLIIYLIAFLVSTSSIYAQDTFLISNTPTTVTDPIGIFVDDGGSDIPGFYSNQLTSAPQVFTICPDGAGCVIMDFSTFITQNSSNIGLGDVLYIYDGPNTSAPLIGAYSGALLSSANAFGQVFAGSGCMTFLFNENGGTTTVGWEGEWTSFTSTCETRSSLDPPVDCETAILICDEETLSYNSNGDGTEELFGTPLAGCLSAGENESAWFVINISQSAPPDIPLEFTIVPTVADDDYDFTVYGPVEDCSELGAPIRCSYADDNQVFTNQTGLRDGEIDVTESDFNNAPLPNSNGFVAPVITSPGETYYIFVDNFSNNNNGFDLYWGEDVKNNNLLDCSICDFALIMPGDFSVCQGEPFDLDFDLFKGSGSFDYAWSSEPAINFTGEKPIKVTPDLEFSGDVVFTLIVTDKDVNNCFREGTVTVDIQSGFTFNDATIDQLLCPGDTTTANILGVFPNNTEFEWLIGDANYISGDTTSTGPVEFTWDTDGDKTITVNIQQGDCGNIPVKFQTEVLPIIETPVISCPSPQSDSTFTWASINAATNYLVTVLVNNVQVDEFSTFQTSHTVEGAQGEFVTITVLPTPGNGFCDGESASMTCEIVGCAPPEDFDIVGLNSTYCVENNAVPLIGNPSGGTFTIRGEEVTSFDPTQTTSDTTYVVEYSILDDLGCTFVLQDTVDVIGDISAAFSMPDSICTDGFAIVEYTGNAGADATFQWDFGDGIPSTTTGPGPIEVNWENPGYKLVSLSVFVNDCESDDNPNNQFISVLQTPIIPDLACDPTTASGTASVIWTTEAGHIYYTDIYINENSIPSFPTTDGFYTSPPLNDGDTLSMYVYSELVGQTYCGVSDSVYIECIVTSCVDTPINITGIDETYCLENQVIEITTDPVGGTLSTTSAGLVDNTFTLADAGAGEHSIVYTWEDENGCPNDTSFTTTIFEMPTASFSISADSLCEGSSATVTYDGTEGAGGFVWNFGEGFLDTIPLGNNSYTVTWSSIGTKIIDLSVSANGCPSTTVSDSLVIVPEPQTPVITCGPSTEDCVTFVWNASPGDSGYTFSLLITNPDGSQVPVPTIQIDTVGYTRCGLEPGTTVRINNLTALGINPCGNAVAAENVTCEAIDCQEILNIDGLPANLCADETAVNFTFVAPDGAVISGDGVTQNGNSTATFDPATAGSGVHTINLDYTDPDTSCPPYNANTQIEVFAVPTADFNIAGGQTEFCIGDAIDFTDNSSAGIDSRTWAFGNGSSPSSSTIANPSGITYSSVGTKTISLEVNDNGCLDDTSQEITIVAPLETPVVTCGNTDQTSVTFEWGDIPGSTGYAISYTIDSSAPVTDNLAAGTTSYTVPSLSPGQTVEITVIALGNEPCGDSDSASRECIAQNCPTINPAITDLDNEYCDDCGSPITLTATPAGGTFTIDADTTPVTEFDLCGLSGTFTVNYEYIEGACTYSTSQQVTVNTPPTSSFDVSTTEICLGGAIDINFTGTAGATANYTWDFGTNANPANASTEGPHNVSWTTSGVKTITLNLTENNCPATEVSTTIEVFDPISAPTISCTGSTENSVGFSWGDVGGTGEFIYDVYVNGTLDLTAQSTFDTNYDRGGLNPGDSVRVVIYAIGSNICGDSPTSQQTCFAENCPTLTPTIDGLNTAYCQNEGIIALNATNTGGDNTGTGEFTLNSIVITEFDTNQTPGNYTIDYTYTQGSCSGSTSQQVTINEQPEAGIAALLDACIGELVDVSFNGTAPAGANYTWDFGTGAIPATETGEGPFQVVWDSEGTKTINVTVEQNGCQDDSSITLEVISPLETPVVQCTEVTQNQITFDWDDVADSYSVSVIINSVPSFDDPAFTDERHIVTNLVPGDEVSIVVEPLGGAPCGNGIAGSTTCIAADCPDETLEILMDNTSFCADEATVILSATPEGGTFTIDNDPTIVGDFNPVLASIGTHTIYYNYTDFNSGCPYSTSIEVNVLELPTAEFTLADTRACPDEPIALEFIGSAPNTSDSGFDWSSFNGGDILSGLGGGPYELSWGSSGMKTISLQVTTDNGCIANFEQIIDIGEINLQVPSTLTISEGDSTEIIAIGNSTIPGLVYTWGTDESLSCLDCPNPFAKPETTTTYTVMIEDEIGCTESASVTVEVMTPESLPQVTIINSFSPNGDGMNDLFHPVFDEMTVGMNMQIYNRWGKMVFESSDRDAFWDGTYNDEIVPVGVYVYWMVIEFANGESRLFTGNVTVIR